MKIMISMN